MKNKKKKKINFKGLIVILLIIYLIGSVLLYVFKMPVRNVVIKNNNIVSDMEIIKTAGVKEYPPLIKVNKLVVRKKLMKNTIIKDVKIKKSLLGKVTIIVNERKPLFYNRNLNKLILSDNVSTNDIITSSIPSLINYVPEEIYLDFVEDFDKIDKSVIGMISEIEYQPLYSNEKIIDDKRFLLRMVDGNNVYINTVNIEQLNNYPDFFATLDGKKGTLNLDSSTSSNFVFKPFGSGEEVIPSEN